jgi:glucose-1-phosphate cytidylyltransferase
MRHSEVRINGGFFVFKHEIFDFIEPGDDLVDAPFSRLMERRELVAYPYEGFFGPMDTIKDRQRLEGLYEAGAAPWLRSESHDAIDRRR